MSISSGSFCLYPCSILPFTPSSLVVTHLPRARNHRRSARHNQGRFRRLALNSTVAVSSPTLPGGKVTQTDSKGNYRLSNLPPGPYVITVTAEGFATVKREGLIIEVGHLPTIDLTLTVGRRRRLSM